MDTADQIVLFCKTASFPLANVEFAQSSSRHRDWMPGTFILKTISLPENPIYFYPFLLTKFSKNHKKGNV